MTPTPHITSINISTEKGKKKTPVTSAKITMEGIEGDAHAGDWHRQISLLAQESIDKMLAKVTNIELRPGDFAENLTTQGIDLLSLPIGTRIQLGEQVILEVTQIGKECHQGCEIRKQVGDCVMPREGIFGKVVAPGKIEVGDSITAA